MVAFTDSQLRTVWNPVHGLPPEKRGVFLERMVLGRSSEAVALSIAISTTRCAWHCGD
jgi:DNA-directed RNA polymerase specialized sigma24 family protein